MNTSNSCAHRVYRCYFRWQFEQGTEQELSTAEIILTQGCSRLKSGAAGKGNDLMARSTRALHERFPHIPILPQEEVRIADPDLPYVGVASIGDEREGKSSMSWNTYEVARIQAEYCRKHGLTRAIIVAHPFHMGRSLWVYEDLGLTTIPAPMLGKTSDYYGEADLVHPSHRFATSAFAREILCRTLFLLQGKI
jgi:hypothetical protein